MEAKVVYIVCMSVCGRVMRAPQPKNSFGEVLQREGRIFILYEDWWHLRVAFVVCYDFLCALTC